MTLKTAIITGASKGIGAATAHVLATNGYQVFNFDIAQGESEHNVQWIACDVSDSAQVKTAVDEVIQTTQTIDAVVISAGIHYSGRITDTDDATLQRVFDINFNGAFYTLRETIKHMQQQKAGGKIVVVSSDQNFVGKVASAAYGPTKAALAQLVKGIAIDYADANIFINAVCPGTIDTPLYRNAIEKYHQKSQIPLAQIKTEEAARQLVNRIGTAQEVAAFIQFLCSDQAGFITGAALSIDGGYTAQ